jgi:hypothetical protein
MVGEYLGRLYLTANRKPQAIVRQVHRNRPAREAGKPHPRDFSSVA